MMPQCVCICAKAGFLWWTWLCGLPNTPESYVTLRHRGCPKAFEYATFPTYCEDVKGKKCQGWLAQYLEGNPTPRDWKYTTGTLQRCKENG